MPTDDAFDAALAKYGEQLWWGWLDWLIVERPMCEGTANDSVPTNMPAPIPHRTACSHMLQAPCSRTQPSSQSCSSSTSCRPSRWAGCSPWQQYRPRCKHGVPVLKLAIPMQWLLLQAPKAHSTPDMRRLACIQVRRGLWSSPLMSVGPKLYTLYDGTQTLSGTDTQQQQGGRRFVLVQRGSSDGPAPQRAHTPRTKAVLFLPPGLPPITSHAVPRFTLPSNVTFEGGLAGFTIQGPFNAATVVKVGSLVPAGGNRQHPALHPPLLLIMLKSPTLPPPRSPMFPPASPSSH